VFPAIKRPSGLASFRSPTEADTEGEACPILGHPYWIISLPFPC
jgi:hypothetical protein